MSKSIHTPAAIATFTTFGIDALNIELKARKLGTCEDPTMGATILAMGCRSLDEYSATIINLSGGTIDADGLKAGMQKAFPEHKIGDRHGNHYLSLARKGNLQGNVECHFQPAKSSRKKKAGHVGIDVASMNTKQRAALAKVLRASNPEVADQILAMPEAEVKPAAKPATK